MRICQALRAILLPLSACALSHGAVTLQVTGPDSITLTIEPSTTITGDYDDINYFSWGTSIGVGTIDYDTVSSGGWTGGTVSPWLYDGSTQIYMDVDAGSVVYFEVSSAVNFGAGPDNGAMTGGTLSISGINLNGDLTTLDFSTLNGAALSGGSGTNASLAVTPVPEPSGLLLGGLGALLLLRRRRD